MMTSSNPNGELFPKPLIKTWGCRISLDSEWCEKFKYIYVDKTRYPKFRSTGENRSNGPARSHQTQTGCYFPNHWSEHGVVAYRWIQNDVKISNMYVSIIHGIQNVDLRTKIGQMGQLLLNSNPKWVLFPNPHVHLYHDHYIMILLVKCQRLQWCITFIINMLCEWEAPMPLKIAICG